VALELEGKAMKTLEKTSALIVGAGPGISASLARQLIANGVSVAMAARNEARLRPLATELGALPFQTDASDPASVAALFDQVDQAMGPVDIVIYNASSKRSKGSLLDLDPAIVAQDMAVSAFGGFLVVQQAARRMVPRGKGKILLTGATASLKGFAGSAAFAMGKFALRGLAQSAARELGPKGIHVAHFVIDGMVCSATRPDPSDQPDSTLDPDEVAKTYLHVLQQTRSAWTFETDLRPFAERF
jgi:NAD(P)-dependent dehydrogenase (short-subunit alcohol dehydrogenase family)